MRIGPGGLDEYQRLRAIFLVRVQDRLRSGEWNCEAFDPANGPELRLIPLQLWGSLEFHPFEDKVSGAGFTFVGLHMSASQQSGCTEPLPRPASGKVRLGEVFELVATPDEADEYAGLKSAAQPMALFVPGAPETEYQRRHRLCRDLQNRLWTRVLIRLLSSEWVAEGFTRGSPQRVRIPPETWPELRCDFDKEEAYSAPELDLQFYKVLVDPSPASQNSDDPPGTSRRALNDWLRGIAKVERSPVRKTDLLDEAKIALEDQTIAFHLLETCLRETGLGPVLLFRGRPKK
jgi:hypothetical protein